MQKKSRLPSYAMGGVFGGLVLLLSPQGDGGTEAEWPPQGGENAGAATVIGGGGGLGGIRHIGGGYLLCGWLLLERDDVLRRRDPFTANEITSQDVELAVIETNQVTLAAVSSTAPR